MDVKVYFKMSCSTEFFKQCKWWSAYAVISIATVAIACLVLDYKNFGGWDLVSKVIIVWGTATCVVWWSWVMKKLYDIAKWWMKLHHDIDTAVDLLRETKQDIKDLKGFAVPK